MIHAPSPIGSGVEAFAVALAERGRSGSLAVYAGAGLSRAEPAAIPTGYTIAERLVGRLSASFPALDDVDSTDLPSVADAVASLSGGEEALLQATVRVAEFTTATPTYGHRVLAALLLEGLLDVLTTNWDDCIERGNEHERVAAVVTAQDLVRIVGPSVLKIHGSATQPESLLITSAHLAAPPTWVVDQTRARLGASTVVFVGIGDVAGYVKTRITEAIDEIGNVANIRVVSPGIVDDWDSSQWSALAPDLVAAHRIPLTADGFLEQLAAAYILAVVGDIRASLETDPVLKPFLSAAVTALNDHDALTILAWVRHAAVVPSQGSSVLGSPPMALALCAVGSIAPDGFVIRDNVLSLPSGQSLEVLVASGIQTAARMEREARNRLEHAVSIGRQAPRFLVAGGIGSIVPAGMPRSILSVSEADDILDGPQNGVPEILIAEEVVRS